MSFQRIFEMVKRQGMPLVITDGQGKDPLIVLPLDLYEALADGRAVGPTDPGAEQEPVIVPVKDESTRPDASGHAENGLGRFASPPKPPAEADLLADLSREERFYIESIDEDKMS